MEEREANRIIGIREHFGPELDRLERKEREDRRRRVFEQVAYNSPCLNMEAVAAQAEKILTASYIFASKTQEKEKP